MNKSLLRQILNGLVVVTIIFFSLGQFGRLPFFDVAIYASDITMALAWVVYLTGLSYHLYPFALPPFGRIVIVFLVIAGLSLLSSLQLYPLTEVISGALYFVRYALYLGLLVIPYAIYSPKLRVWFFDAMIAAGVAVATAGLLQLAVVPDFTFMARFGWDPHYGRLLSTFFDPNFSGAFLSLIFVPTLALFLQAQKNRLAYYLSLVVMYLALLLTYSRGSYLNFSVSMILFAMLARSKKLLAISLMLIAFLLLMSIPRQHLEARQGIDRLVSAQARLSSWDQGVIIAWENPIFGVGFNNYRSAQKQYGFLNESELTRHSATGNDSSLLFVLATTGLFGFLTYGVLLVSLLFMLLYKKPHSLMRLAVGCGLVGLLLQTQFINALFYPPIMGLLWLLVLIAYL